MYKDIIVNLLNKFKAINETNFYYLSKKKSEFLKTLDGDPSGMGFKSDSL